MTFKELKTQLSKLQPSIGDSKLLERLRNKPFWVWDQKGHKQQDLLTNGDCCFNHIVGLPVKDKLEYPIFDYEKILYDSLLKNEGNFKDKHLWVKKSTGLGITEFFLRLMAWLCTSDGRDAYSNGQMCIVTGPNIDIAIKLIKRMKGIFERNLGLNFTNKETVLELNGCRIEAFPSNHIDSFRALDNPKFILLDESDFWRKSEIDNVRHVSERYIGKSDPYLVMISTPNAPDGLFEKIEKEPEETCLYKRLKLDYTYGIGKIYSKQDIEKAKNSPSFEREYNLKYLGQIGNVFNTREIELAIEKGKNYDPDKNNEMCQKSIGIDPAYGSSAFGIVITQWQDQQIQILHADEYKRPDFNEMLDLFWSLYERYHPVNKIHIDGANPSFIKSLKIMLGERSNYETVPKEHWRYMKVQPVNFATRHKAMLGHSKLLLEKGYIAINEKFDKLITSLRTAVATENTLDKEATSYNDIFDSFRLALEYYQARGYQAPNDKDSEQEQDSISNSEVKI